MKRRKYEIAPFELWRNSETSLGEYLWPQLDYRLDNLQTYHVCWEVRSERKLANNPAGLLSKPLPVIRENQSLLRFGSKVGEEVLVSTRTNHERWSDPVIWDAANWHKYLSKVVGIDIVPRGTIAETPRSLDSYHRLAKLSNVSCIDIDFLEPCQGEMWVAIETTHFYKPMFSRIEAARLVSFVIGKRFALAKAHQLKTQYNWTQAHNFPFWIVFYNIKDTGLDANGMVFRIKIDPTALDILTGRAKPDFSNFIYEPFSEFLEWLRSMKSIRFGSCSRSLSKKI